MDENMSSDSSSIQSTLQTILTEVRGLKTDVAGLKTDVAGLKTDVAGLKTDVAGLGTRLDTFESEVRQFKLDTVEMWREVAQRIDDRTETLRREFVGFKAEVRAEEARTRHLWRSELGLEARAAQSQIDDLNGRVTAIERRMVAKTEE